MTLFFMFERRNINKNTSLSAACSLIHQLLLKLSQDEGDQFSKELVEHKDECGQSKADDSDLLWCILRKQLERLSSVALVLDALDECKDHLPLMDHLSQLCSTSTVRVIILSRRERDIAQQLEAWPQIMIHDGQTKGDILRFLNEEIVGCSKLSLPSVSALVLQTFEIELAQILLERANGSFLWAALVIEELRRKQTPWEIVETLKKTPSGIEELYRSILTSYAKELDQDTRRICQAVLRWLACATRPLLVDEVWEALRVEYTEMASGTMENAEFFLTRQEMVDSCGSLVRNANETLFLAHLSLSEFLHNQQRETVSNHELTEFLIYLPNASWRLALSLIEYISACSSHFTSGTHDKHRMLSPTLMMQQHPFLEYAVSKWLFHLGNCEVVVWQEVPASLSAFCLSSPMLFWLQSWFSRDGQNLWLLEKQMRRIAISSSGGQLQSSCSDRGSAFMQRWSIAMLQFLERHGSCCEEEPSYVHSIDPASFDEDNGDSSIFTDFVSQQPWLHTQHDRLHVNAHRSHNGHGDKLPLPKTSRIQFGVRAKPAFGIFYVDQQRKVLIMADYMSSAPKLFCQDVNSGRTLPPTAHPYDKGRIYWCEGYAVSKDGRYFAVYYRSYLHNEAPFPEDSRHHVIVWEISSHLDFGEDQAMTWCTPRRVISQTTRNTCYSPQPLAFGSDGILVSPYGRIDPCSGQFDGYLSPVSDKGVDRVSVLRDNGALGGLAFSKDTSTLLFHDTNLKRLVQVQIEDMTEALIVQPYIPDVCICCISPRGRYAVWRESKALKVCYLQDFKSSTTKTLPGSEGILFPTHSLLAFSTDEACLFGILTPQVESDLGKRCVSIWTHLSSEPKQTTSPIIGELVGFHFTTLQEPAYLATSERWTRFDPLELQTVADKFLQPSSVVQQQVSVHGDRLVMLLYAPNERANVK